MMAVTIAYNAECVRQGDGVRSIAKHRRHFGARPSCCKYGSAQNHIFQSSISCLKFRNIQCNCVVACSLRDSCCLKRGFQQVNQNPTYIVWIKIHSDVLEIKIWTMTPNVKTFFLLEKDMGFSIITQSFLGE